MREYAYTIEFRDSVTAGSGAERKFNKLAHTVIPGGTVRGALAAAWWRTQGSSAEDFAALFDRALVVGQAVPRGFELVSASIQGCKYRPKPECVKVAFDAALSPKIPEECPKCQGPLAGRPGWHDRASSTEMGRLASTRMTPEETAEDGNLFARQALRSAEDTALACDGTLLLLEDDGDLSWVGDGITVRVGGKRSSGLGQGALTLREVPQTPALAPNQVQAVIARSPLILLDEYGGPALDSAGLERALQQVCGERLQVEARPGWLRTVPIEGFHVRSALPKRREWALDAGSVFVVHELTAEHWARVRAGLGYRTLEGFGAVELFGVDLAMALWQRFRAANLAVMKKPAEFEGVQEQALNVLEGESLPSPEAFPHGTDDLIALYHELRTGPARSFRLDLKKAKKAPRQRRGNHR